MKKILKKIKLYISCIPFIFKSIVSLRKAKKLELIARKRKNLALQQLIEGAEKVKGDELDAEDMDKILKDYGELK